MGFKKIKAKVKHARGAGPDLILKSLKENFSAFEESMKGLSEAEQNEVRDKFEKVIEGAGDAVLGDASEFEMTETDWSPEDKAKFCGLLCPDYFEVNEDEE